MKSGVTQALPQIAMPRTGTVAKVDREGAPRADFAEALGLGKPAKPTNPVGGKPATAGAEATPAHAIWPRSASKLENTISGVRDDAQVPTAEATPPNDDGEDVDADERPGAGPAEAPEVAPDQPAIRADDGAVADAPSPQPVRSGAVASQTPIFVPAPAVVSASTGSGTPRAGTPPMTEPRAGVHADIPLDAEVSAFRSPDSAGEKPRASPLPPMHAEDQPKPVRFEPAIKQFAPTGRTPTDEAPAKDVPSQASHEPAKAAPRVTVLAQQNIPAPAPSTTLVLVQSIASSSLIETTLTRSLPDAIHGSATHGAAQSLKIQLHPAELGMVTATLRFAGEQLSIELRVENQEAYRRLSGDSDLIVGSLRELGYDVERVTVLQPSIASTPVARTDTSITTPAPQGRFAEQSGSGGAGGGSGGSGGNSPEHRGNTSHNSQGQPRREDSNGGIYI